ncbi:MAG: hypothetical protein IJM33_06895 [Bacteroidales bacterium]|nr:hypothetical protein [Bacteroidales bacterium]MBR3412428.1 hypothetical protein [Bacteroidales bacterium]
MKRLLLLVILLPSVLVVGCHHKVEQTQEGALYKRYAARTDMTVAQVCDFKLCDTVFVDVVLLQADDEESWQRMVEEFAIRDTAGVTSWLGDIENPALRVEWNGQPVVRVAASHEKRSVGLYRIDTETQYDALLDYQLNNLH